MIDSTLEWESCFDYYKNGQSTGKPITYRFSKKDTVFKSDTFKILMAYTAVDTFIMGGLREDTLERKIYGFYYGDTASYLMYDFSFPNGTIQDTLWINPTEPDSNYKVNVSPFQDFSGKTRKNVQLCCGYSYYNTQKYKVDYIDWYEGLGSNAGLIHNVIINKLPPFRYPNAPKRDTHFLGIRKVHQIGQNNPLVIFTCNFDTSLVSLKENLREHQDLNIYYDHSNEVIIKSSSNIESIKLLTIEGRDLKDWGSINNTEFNFSGAHLTTGWYVLRVQIKNDLIYYRKLIINY